MRVGGGKRMARLRRPVIAPKRPLQVSRLQFPDEADAAPHSTRRMRQAAYGMAGNGVEDLSTLILAVAT
jgi:hypothetical protein